MLKLLPKYLDKCLVCLVAFLLFLIPFFFLPITTEYYEFNKQALLAVLLVIGYSLLVTRMVLRRKLTFQPKAGRPLAYVRTKLDLPIFLLLLVYAASTIFSISPATSFLGQHGVFHGGLLSLILYIALFYLVVNVVGTRIDTNDQQMSANERIKNKPFAHSFKFAFGSLKFAFILSSLTLAILAILQYFEIYIFNFQFSIFNFQFPFTHQRFWTPIGGVKTLMVYLLATLPLLTGWVLKEKGFKKIFLSLVLLVGLAAVFLVSGWGGGLRPPGFSVLPTEASLDWQTSWQIANSVLAFRPLFGSGPATFFANFTRFKPQSFNQKPFWNIRFNHPANEWFGIVACLGLSGFLAWTYLWTKIFKFSIFKRSKLLTIQPFNHLTIFSLPVFFISIFFVPLTTVTSVLFWTLLALFVTEAGLTEEVLIRAEAVVTDSKGKSRARSLQLNKILASSLLLLASCFSFFYFLRFYRAEIHYQEATLEFSQNREKAFNLALSATQLNPFSDVYQIGLTTASLGVSSQLSQQASPSAQLIQQFVDRAVVAGSKAIQLNPENVRNWESLAGLYQNLLSFDPNAGQQVVNSFQQAVNLDPMNPVLRDWLANFLLQRGKAGEAIDQLLLAIRLKQDYAQAHYDLAQAYKAVDNWEGVREELQAVLILVPRDAPQRETVELELQNLGSEEATQSGELEQ